LEDYYLIAEIKTVFNADGYLRIKSFSDFPERFFLLDKVFINIYGDFREFTVENVESIEDSFVLKFKNFDSDEETEFLIGSMVYIKQNELVELEDDTYFIHDLLDCKVFYNEKFFGKIVNVLSLSSNDVYVTEDESGIERLIPAVSEFIDKVDVGNKTILLRQDFDELNDDAN
jgi:16S rRNA processing protein RimM